MARDVEITGISTNIGTQTLPTAVRSPQYKQILAGTTWSLSTSAYIDRITVVPGSSGTGTVQLLDGSTAVFTIPAVGHLDAKPYTLHLGITNQSSLGFKVITGASVAVVVAGQFAATPTTA